MDPTQPAETPLRDRFFNGVRTSDLDAVRGALEEDASLVHAFDPDHFEANPITVAVHFGNIEMVDLLLEFGGDINRKSDWWAGGFAPIHSIPRHHRPRVLPALLERGAVLDVHAAAQHGDFDRVRELIEEDPKRVHERGGDGQHPLHFAETVEIAEYLLDQGADLEARCIDHHSTPAQWAAGDRPEVCRFLIERGAKQDPWMLAAIGATEAVGRALDERPELLSARLDPDFDKGPNDEVVNIYMFTLGQHATLLHIATARGHRELAALLLERGADVNARGAYDESTPLHGAAWHDDVDTARWLIENGAEVDVPSGKIHNNTPLGWAIVAGRPRMVELLLGAGASIEPFHVEDVEAGVNGRFSGWTDATRENYQEVGRILREREEST